MVSANPLPGVLQVDASHRNTGDWRKTDDIFNRFFRFADGKGINNSSGFRPKSKAGGSTDIVDCAFCILVTNFEESEWPDRLDAENGLFIYYGDNRSAGKAVNDTAIGGNRLLEHLYELLHSGRRAEIPPLLCFEKYHGADGVYMRFLGLACPGALGVPALEDLVAVWRIKERRRFQNYRALFTILAEEKVARPWLEDLVAGVPPATSTHCPRRWQQWVKTGLYSPLRCERRREPRSRADQMPRTPQETAVLRAVHEALSDREFEFAASALTRLIDARFGDLVVTRPVRDGGRDGIGSYRVGHDQHQVLVSVSVEAKRWRTDRAVGVKPMMRLISRLKHRDVGVFVTTSFFDQQVQNELIEDNHPVLLVTGGDVARILIQNEIVDPSPGGKLAGWIESVKQSASEGVAPSAERHW